MKVKSEGTKIAAETFEVESERKSVSEKDIATLNNYADQKLQETTQLSEVMNTMPPTVQRGGIYLVSAAVGLTSILLYFSKVPVWIESPGNIVPEAYNVSVTAAKPGVVTAVKAKAGQQLAKDATLLEIKPAISDDSDTVGSQAETWQAIQQKELEITQTKIELAQLQMQLTKTEEDANPQDLVGSIEKIKALEAEVAGMKSKNSYPLSSVANNKITMPQAGIVSQLKVDQLGESIARDTVVATVIPDTNNLVVETVISDRNIATIKPGMPARIKIDAYDFREFGTIPALISQVIPNLDRPGEFIVILDLLKNKLTQKGQEINLLPGLNVQVEINAEEKRLLELLFSKQ